MARNHSPYAHLSGIASNIQSVLDSGVVQSLEEALNDKIPERARNPSGQSISKHGTWNKLKYGTWGKLPQWLKTLYLRVESPELQAMNVVRRRGESLDVALSETKKAHPRALSLIMGEPLKSAFWINLVIACDGPVGSATVPTSVDLASKSRSQLPNALKDLSAMSEFYRPIMVGNHHIQIPGSISRSEGYFNRTVILANPSPEEVELALDVLLHWVLINSGDLEFERFTFNFFYSGHANQGDSPGQSCLFLGNTRFYTESLVERLLASTSRWNIIAQGAKVNIFLDCCYSAAVARDMMVHLQAKQDTKWRESTKPHYICGMMHCSSLDDEKSFDKPGLGHSFFVAAFLRENSSGKASKRWPHLHEIGSRTNFRQSPVLINVQNKMLTRFPLRQLAKPEVKRELQSEELKAQAVQNLIQLHKLQPTSDGYIDMHQIDYILASLKLEREVIKNPNNQLEASEIKVPLFDERVHQWLF